MTDLSTAFHWTSGTTAAGPSRVRGLFGALLREIRIRRALRHVSTLDDATRLIQAGAEKVSLNSEIVVNLLRRWVAELKRKYRVDKFQSYALISY